jgi:hypothetical protein
LRAVALAVDRAAGRAEDNLPAVDARRLEHVQRADDVHVRIEVRALDGDAHVDLRAKVEAHVRLHLREDGVGVSTDVARVQPGAV